MWFFDILTNCTGNNNSDWWELKVTSSKCLFCSFRSLKCYIYNDIKHKKQQNYEPLFFWQSVLNLNNILVLTKLCLQHWESINTSSKALPDSYFHYQFMIRIYGIVYVMSDYYMKNTVTLSKTQWHLGHSMPTQSFVMDFPDKMYRNLQNSIAVSKLWFILSLAKNFLIPPLSATKFWFSVV